MAFKRQILSWKTSIINVRLAYKSFLSRFLMLINYTMCSSNLFFCIELFPTFFIVQNFQSPHFSGPSFFWVQVFLSLGFSGLRFSGSRFFKVQVFLSPGFSGSWSFRVKVFQGLGPGSGSRVWVQVLEVTIIL